METRLLEEEARCANRLCLLCCNTCAYYNVPVLTAIVSVCLLQVEARLLEEQARGTNYLHVATVPKLKEVIEAEFITAHAQAMISHDASGCNNM